MESIELHELEQAIGRCIHAEKKQPYRLPADASKMANVLGQMIYHQVKSWPFERTTQAEVEAFHRWKC
ncbi:DUF3717 domain-containing protein [Chromobacterium piscinae]|uniref:DUF3717 domain-containing protein n=1 Tax=Chromobacterium piscinae TaxID=686831 RepID=UPI001E47F7A7|nr:DUF3717 domain-containing protein [Chromobacterium piscinae]